ncbi:MAG TPA: VOC family protein [Alphaproteobacteria bacterium]|jgi:hypothetical protein|nr:VOC family protein [Alphaproteobacteria bacterium]HJM50771.1 VOC family protein [Alphaproteobacteria bacterium]|tara:strand:- start:367 stop:1212 length:846 start_codon:yes stop_codon:yes gene_type:complete
MAEKAILDHAVINVRYRMDQAEGAFRDLGFHLTERGYHTLGSINHLMMFESDYLELIGLPADRQGGQPGRPDIANAPLGINGLVFKTADVDETYAHLQDLGMAGDPPKSFSRPVQLAGGAQDARFRTVHLRGDVFPGGRVYYCQHGTPELVWRQEWQSHANGARAIPEFVVASQDQESEAENFARLLNSDVSGSGESRNVALPGGQISVMTPASYGERYGALATSLGQRSSIFGALVFRTEGLDGIRSLLAGMANPLPVIDEAERVVVRQPDFDCLLEFRT